MVYNSVAKVRKPEYCSHVHVSLYCGLSIISIPMDENDWVFSAFELNRC